MLPTDLAHAEHCAVRLDVVVVADRLVQARRSLWLSSEQLMPPVDFHVGPYDDFYDGWSLLLGADMVVGRPQRGPWTAAAAVARPALPRWARASTTADPAGLEKTRRST